MSILIKPKKIKKKRWFLPFWSIAAVAFLALLLGGTFVWLGWHIYFASYKEPDKRWSDLISLTPEFIAVFTVVGGAISWLSVRNEKRKNQLGDLAETSLITNYNPTTYLYDVSISLLENSKIEDVIHVIELRSKVGSVTARQVVSTLLIDGSINYQIRINEIARRFHIGYDDIEAVNSFLIYRSHSYYWKLSSSNNERFKIKNPKIKALSASGSLAYLNNTIKEIEENLYRGKIHG